MLPCCTCIFCQTLSEQVADVMVLYPEYFRVPSQEWHFPTWDNSQYFSESTRSIRNLVIIQPVPLCLNISVVAFFKHIAFYNYVSSVFLFKNKPLLFSFLLTLFFFFFFWHQATWLVSQSVFVRLFPCGGAWFVPESGPWIPWRPETRPRGRTRFWLNLFWQDCFTEGTTPRPWHRRR